jgi:hypothetical protein
MPEDRRTQRTETPSLRLPSPARAAGGHHSLRAQGVSASSRRLHLAGSPQSEGGGAPAGERLHARARRVRAHAQSRLRPAPGAREKGREPLRGAVPR